MSQLVCSIDAEGARQLGLIIENHDVFSLDVYDRGETDVLQMDIDTEGTLPRRQSACRMLFAVRPEVTKQIQEMQESGVIQPSKSPWVSPVVMVKKKDGSHRFCVDYRG